MSQNEKVENKIISRSPTRPLENGTAPSLQPRCFQQVDLCVVTLIPLGAFLRWNRFDTRLVNVILVQILTTPHLETVLHHSRVGPIHIRAKLKSTTCGLDAWSFFEDTVRSCICNCTITSNRLNWSMCWYLTFGSGVTQSSSSLWLRTSIYHSYLSCDGARLVQRNCECWTRPSTRRTPLLLAISMDLEKGCEALLAKGANIEATDKEGWASSPLILSNSGPALSALSHLLPNSPIAWGGGHNPHLDFSTDPGNHPSHHFRAHSTQTRSYSTPIPNWDRRSFRHLRRMRDTLFHAFLFLDAFWVRLIFDKNVPLNSVFNELLGVYIRIHRNLQHNVFSV